MQTIISEVFERGEIDFETERLLKDCITRQQLTVNDLEALDTLLLALFNRKIVWRYGDVPAIRRNLNRVHD
ncbi:MAG: hypothetical protein AAF974_00490 [Cyanobacteria bacterium P01_E01_bin.34]